MACNFSANQFEGSFAPKRLGNWEVPLRHPPHPHTRTSKTRVIADDRGHLLPGVRATREGQWGRGPFTAWDQPRRITRKYANQMDAQANARYTAWLKRSAHVPLPQQEAPPTPIKPSRAPTKSARPRKTSATEVQRTTRQSSARSSRASLPKPPESVSEIKDVSPPISAPPSLAPSSRRSSRPHTAAPGSDRRDSQDSGVHPPAPSLVSEQTQARRAANPGMALPAPRRPSTSGGPIMETRRSLTEEHPSRLRPSTGHPLGRVTAMDLAIRWDLRLPGEKRNTGLGAKVAPAVFNSVPPAPSHGDCGLPGGCNTPPPRLPRSAWGEETQRPSSKGGKENNSPNVPSLPPPEPPRYPTPPSLPQHTPELSKRRSRSTPNLTRRPCAACDSGANSTSKPSSSQTVSSGYKQAFKAGRPNNHRPLTALPAAAPVRVPKPRKPFSKRSYSIATLAPPFSLWPDGSRSQDYPDHWRLASVYQHAYKPPELRRKPLLASVFQ